MMIVNKDEVGLRCISESHVYINYEEFDVVKITFTTPKKNWSNKKLLDEWEKFVPYMVKAAEDYDDSHIEAFEMKKEETSK